MCGVNYMTDYIPSLTIAAQLECARGRFDALGTYASIYTCQKGDTIFFVIINRHSSKSLDVELDCSESTGLLSSRGSLRSEDSIPPNSRQLMMVLTSINKYNGYSWSRKIKYIHRHMSNFGHRPPLAAANKDIHWPHKV